MKTPATGTVSSPAVRDSNKIAAFDPVGCGVSDALESVLRKCHSPALQVGRIHKEMHQTADADKVFRFFDGFFRLGDYGDLTAAVEHPSQVAQ
jgi:hypothetical protein